jgi:predicted nuclease of predicted toxin-antitoxin system
VPRLEFLANMNISPLTVEGLLKIGWNIIRVSEILDKKSKDIEILSYAQNHNKVVITQDLDFSTLLAVRGFRKPSVINLRFSNARPDFVMDRIIEIVSEMEKSWKKESLSVLTRHLRGIETCLLRLNEKFPDLWKAAKRANLL